VDDRRGPLVFKPSSVTTLGKEDPRFAADGSPSRSASSVAALGAILAEDSPGASSSQAEISHESVKRKKAESTTAKHKVPGPRPPAVQANKTDKWSCHGPGCGIDLGHGTKKAKTWYQQKKNGVKGYYCPACYETCNFVSQHGLIFATDTWWCYGPGCGMDLGHGTKKAGNWFTQKKNGVKGYYCPACYEKCNFVSQTKK
jgi:hypothetical protein